MASSSTSLSSENEVKPHPYQCPMGSGPIGAYEARQVKNKGLYIRVEMPGVPPNGVKLVKYGESQTVTFTGKAPKHWPCDSSERVYGGYVVLDRDPNSVDVQIRVNSGSLRLFFPGAEGTLHFLPSKGNNNLHDSDDDEGENPVYGNSDECSHEQFVEYPDDSVIKGLKIMRLHSKGCPCCKNSQKRREPLPSESMNITMSHINPYLLSGVKGVYESKLVVDKTGKECMYLRLDLPGLEAKTCYVMIQGGNSVIYGGRGRKEHHLDEDGRSYLSMFQLRCGCCYISAYKPEFKDGVLRILIEKAQLQLAKITLK